MNLPPRIETWLEQYAEWRNAPVADLHVNSSARPVVIDGVVCAPDGGMTRFIQQHERQLRLEIAARAVQDALPYLPKDLKAVFDATYHGERQHVPRSERDAAERMGVCLTKYRRMKFGMLCFFQGMNCRAFAVASYEVAAGAAAIKRSKGSKS